MTREEINEILKLHRKWLMYEVDGKRADLSGANLSKMDLSRINLRQANLNEANLYRTNLSNANLKWVIFQDADLSWANLSKADLRWASLNGADLNKADLEGADLSGADLRGADLNGANLKNIKNLPLPDLYILKYQKDKIRAFKIVNQNFESIFYSGIKYKIGKMVEEKDFDSDERVLCSKGINVATLKWSLNRKEIEDRILIVEFYSQDIVAIPYATTGIFRIKRCKVIKEWKGKGKN